MDSYGRWLQLPVFPCRLTARRRAALGARLDREIARGEDHVLILDLGPADQIDLRSESLGKPFTSGIRQAMIV